MTPFTQFNWKHVLKNTHDIKRGNIDFEFDEIMFYWKNMKESIKNRNRKVQNLDNPLSYFIQVQCIIKNATPGIN